MAFAKKNQPAETKKPPVHKVRVGSVHASIWENTSEKGTFYSVTFERRYKDGDEWKTSGGYNFSDLLDLAKAADLAHTAIIDEMNKSMA